MRGDIDGGAYGTVSSGGRNDHHAEDAGRIALRDPDGSGGSGPFTRFDGYRAKFVDGLTSGVKVYLDTGWGENQGFEYSVAANGSDGNHQRDFVFHVVSQGPGALCRRQQHAGFNSNEAAAGSVTVSQSGWYTLQHVFHDVGGVLSVDLNLVAEDGNVTQIATLSGPRIRFRRKWAATATAGSPPSTLPAASRWTP